MSLSLSDWTSKSVDLRSEEERRKEGVKEKVRKRMKERIGKWICVSRHHQPICMGCCGNNIGVSTLVTRLSNAEA